MPFFSVFPMAEIKSDDTNIRVGFLFVCYQDNPCIQLRWNNNPNVPDHVAHIILGLISLQVLLIIGASLPVLVCHIMILSPSGNIELLFQYVLCARWAFRSLVWSFAPEDGILPSFRQCVLLPRSCLSSSSSTASSSVGGMVSANIGIIGIRLDGSLGKG